MPYWYDWGAAAEGPGGRAARRGAWGGGEAPTDFTKPRQTIQSPKKTIQRHQMLDKAPKY